MACIYHFIFKRIKFMGASVIKDLSINEHGYLDIEKKTPT